MKLGAWGGDQVVCVRGVTCAMIGGKTSTNGFTLIVRKFPNIRTGKKDIWRLSLTSFVLSFISSFPLVLRL